MTYKSQRALDLSIVGQESSKNFFGNDLDLEEDAYSDSESYFNSSISFTRCASHLTNPLFKLNFQHTSLDIPESLEECREELIASSLSQHLLIPPINVQTSQVTNICPNSRTFSINCMKFCHDGDLLAIGTENGEIKVYNSIEMTAALRRRESTSLANLVPQLNLSIGKSVVNIFWSILNKSLLTVSCKFSSYLYIFDLTSSRNTPLFTLRPIITKTSNGRMMETQVGGSIWDCSCLLHIEVRLSKKKKKISTRKKSLDEVIPSSTKSNLKLRKFGINGISSSNKPSDILPKFSSLSSFVSSSSISSSTISSSSSSSLSLSSKSFFNVSSTKPLFSNSIKEATSQRKINDLSSIISSNKLENNLEPKNSLAITERVFSSLGTKKKKILFSEDEQKKKIMKIGNDIKINEESNSKDNFDTPIQEKINDDIQELIIAGCSDGNIRCWSLPKQTNVSSQLPFLFDTSNPFYQDSFTLNNFPVFEWIVQPPSSSQPGNVSSLSSTSNKFTLSNGGIYGKDKENEDPIAGLILLNPSDLLSITANGSITRWNPNEIIINYLNKKEPKIIHHYTIQKLLLNSSSTFMPTAYRKIIKITDLRMKFSSRNYPSSPSFLDQFLPTSDSNDVSLDYFIEIFLDDGSIYHLDVYNKKNRLVFDSSAEHFVLKANSFDIMRNNNNVSEFQLRNDLHSFQNSFSERSYFSNLKDSYFNNLSLLSFSNPIYSNLPFYSNLYLVCNSFFLREKSDDLLLNSSTVSTELFNNNMTYISMKSPKFNYFDMFSHYSTQNSTEIQKYSIIDNINYKYKSQNSLIKMPVQNLVINETDEFSFTLNCKVIKATKGKSIIRLSKDISPFLLQQQNNIADKIKIEFFHFDYSCFNCNDNLDSNILFDDQIYTIEKVCKNKVLLSSPYNGPTINNCYPINLIKLNISIVNKKNEEMETLKTNTLFSKSLHSSSISSIIIHPNLPFFIAGTNTQSLIIMSFGGNSRVKKNKEKIDEDHEMYIKRLHPYILSEKEKQLNIMKFDKTEESDSVDFKNEIISVKNYFPIEVTNENLTIEESKHFEKIPKVSENEKTLSKKKISSIDLKRYMNSNPNNPCSSNLASTNNIRSILSSKKPIVSTNSNILNFFRK